MNKIFKVVWSKTKNSYVVVSEIAKRNGKCSSSLNKKLIAAFLAAGTVLSVSGNAWAADTIIVNGDEDATANGAAAIAIGTESTVESSWGIAIGGKAQAITSGDVAASALAIGAGAKAIADSTLAIGHTAIADVASSYAIGFEAHASASHAMALGTRATVTGSNGIAIGVQTESTEQAAIAIGSGSKAKGTDSVAIGQSARALGSNSIKIGTSSMHGAAEGFGSVAIGNSSTAIGQWYSTATGFRSLALSDMATTYGSISSASKESVAIGAYSYAGTQNGEVLAEEITNVTRATAIGFYSMATGKLSTATGAYSRAVGSNSTAVGYYSQAGTAETSEAAEKTSATAVGYYSKATGQYSTALGAFTNYSGNDSEGATALGYNSAVTVDNGVALGRGAVANTEAGTTTKTSGYDPITKGPSSIENAIWRSTLGAVSVGSGGTATRQITNVAAGSAETDAVNVAQLKQVATAAENAKTHYYSANSTERGIDSNYNNDGATGLNAVAVGPGAIATGSHSVAIGLGAQATGYGAVAIGQSGALGESGLENGQLIASGDNSYVHGSSAQAAGPDATAWGVNTVAGQSKAGREETWQKLSEMDHAGEPGEKNEFGIGTTAWGQYNEAYGTDATAFGEGNIAYGIHSTAFGTSNETYGRGSTAWGEFNVASGYNSTVFGQSNVASNYQATAFGNFTVASGQASTAFGTNTLASGFMSATAFGFGTVASGSASTAFGMGLVYEDEDGNMNYDDANTASGTASTAFGQYTKATNDSATAFGVSNVASGKASTAFGNATTASGNMATAFGSGTNAIGSRATAFGVNNTASGQAATAFGNLTTASGVMATAFGQYTEASGKGATAFGIGTADEKVTASGVGATAFGSKTEASGDYSTAFGVESKAYGENSLAALGGTVGQAAGNGTAGDDNTTSGDTATASAGKAAVAIGEGAEVFTDYTYAIGQNAIATKDAAGAIVFGNGSTVSGENSIAIGTGLTVTGNNSGAFGDPGTVSGDGSYAIGNDNTIEVNDGFILGSNAEVSYEGGVALGAGSKVLAGDAPTAGGFNPSTGETAYTDNTNVWTATTGPVSVGSSEVTRQIKYVAAGSADTDAVNVAQLKAAQVEIIGGDNVEVIKDTSSGHTVYTIHSLNAIVEAGENVAVTPTTPETTDKTNGQTTDMTAGENGTAGTTLDPVPSDKPIEPSGTNNHTTTYTVDAADSKVDSVKVESGEPKTTGNKTETEYTVTVTSKEQSVEENKIVTKDVEKTGTFTVTDLDTKYEAKLETEPGAEYGKGTTTFTVSEVGGEAVGSGTLEAGENVKITGQDGKAVISAKDTTYTITADAGTGSTINTYTVTDSDGNKLEPIVDTDTQYELSGEEVETTDNHTQYSISLKGTDGSENTFEFLDTRNTVKEGENVTIDTVKNDDGSYTYTINAAGGGGLAEISFNGDNKDSQIDSPKVLNIEGGATGELSDGNIGVESDGKDTLTIKLAKDIKDVDSITVNKNIKVGDNTTIEGDTITTKTVNTDTVKAGGTTINNDGMTINEGPTITKTNIDMHNQQIHNVAPGTADSDAATVGQLKNESGDIRNEINRLDDRTQKGLAGAAALAALHPMDFNPDDKMQFSAGFGHYRGQNAAAIGAFYRPDESVMFSIGGVIGNGDNMVNAGITFGLDGTRNRITRSRTAMAREIQDLRSLVTQMAARMDRLEGANIETAMFPDVPENHWAYEYVEDLQKRGALKGYPDGLFKGDRAMTRYEFAAMLDRLVRSGVTLDSKIAKEFEPELGRIYVERISGQDNDRKKIERVRVNNSDSKYPEGKTRDVYGSKIVTEVPKAVEAK